MCQTRRSILGDETYEFPKPVSLTKTLKDILEPCVDEKYFISKAFKDYIDNKTLKGYHYRVEISKANGIRNTPLRVLGDRALIQEPLACAAKKIRRLTPRECWRLMGVRDEQFDKLHDISNTQLYKMAGNSIVVDVLMKIFKNLLTKGEGDVI